MRISYLQGNEEYNIRIQLEKETLSTHHLRLFGYILLHLAIRFSPCRVVDVNAIEYTRTAGSFPTLMEP